MTRRIALPGALLAWGVIILLARAGVAAPGQPFEWLTVVVASQFLSPVLWDHYALVMLLPTAWLLDRGHPWAAAIPLATSTLLVFTQIELPVAYPVAFWVTLLALAWEGGAVRTLRAQGNRASDGMLAA